jgi:hypothetical protein
MGYLGGHFSVGWYPGDRVRERPRAAGCGVQAAAGRRSRAGGRAQGGVAHLRVPPVPLAVSVAGEGQEVPKTPPRELTDAGPLLL